MYYLAVEKGNVDPAELVSPQMTYIFYMVVNVGQTDLFNTESQYLLCNDPK